MLASLDRSGVETCAARVCVFGSDRSDRLVSREALASLRDGGSAWSFAIASAALAQQSATAVRQPASPALAVKAGRQRGISVLDKRRQEQQQEMAAAEAAAAILNKLLSQMLEYE